MKNASMSFLEYLNAGWGKRATGFLKEGANFKLLIDEGSFSLSKNEGKMEINAGAPKHYDILLETTSPAIKYLCDAKTEEDAHERLHRLIARPTPEKYSRMTIQREVTEKGKTEFWRKGYYFWARRMEFVS
jgi:hypothetical protein